VQTKGKRRKATLWFRPEQTLFEFFLYPLANLDISNLDKAVDIGGIIVNELVAKIKDVYRIIPGLHL
jgi:hypothetical protein